MVTHAAWSLPGCGPVHVVHVENSAVAVDTGLPVWSDRHGRRIEGESEVVRREGQSQLVLADVLNRSVHISLHIIKSKEF